MNGGLGEGSGAADSCGLLGVGPAVPYVARRSVDELRQTLESPGSLNAPLDHLWMMIGQNVRAPISDAIFAS